ILVSRKLTLEPKVTVNARIVVVGASDTGLSFLEVLCLCPHLRFHNLTLVSTHGYPGDHGDHEDSLFSASCSHAFSSRDLAQLPLHSCVTVVTGKMVGINRKSKCVRVSGGAKVPYDHLVLCTGLQYQVGPGGRGGHTRSWPGSRYTGPVPSNLFTLNDLHDCSAARRWLRANFVELEGDAVVYGSGVDVFTTAEALLGLGVRGGRVHLVLTPPELPGASGLGDPVVEKAVAVALGEAGVRVHRGRLLAQMNDGEVNPEPLASVTFASHEEEEPLLRLRCGVFLNVSNKGVDRDAFQSINNSFLVFDSRLVVSASFHTSDPAVSGAGPLTKLSRCYYADEWSHANFNSKEVGRDLAAMLLPLFDPTLEVAVERPPPDGGRLVPLYKQPKVKGGKLPGGFNYLHVTKPPPTEPTGAQQVRAADVWYHR
uniref:CFAP61 dimerisation domain-containing protein n=1 Tax=Cyclopterus lumpus TaxID=8103 RepID=A0A8C2Z8W1_CYCLU